MTTKAKFYVVWKGRQTGVFRSWAECAAQVNGYPGAQYKAFDSRAAAEQAFGGAYADYKGKTTVAAAAPGRGWQGQVPTGSYAVDAACSGNPGPLEYRCVALDTGEQVFHGGPYAHGTNNVGEFLAIVHALAFLQQRGSASPIYSDSENALFWVRIKKCRTKLAAVPANAELFELIRRAEEWLATHRYTNPLCKWQTDAWGEIPADFGRK